MLSDSSKPVAQPAAAMTAKNPGNPYHAWPWGPAAAIFMTVIAFVASQLLAGGVLAIGLAIAGWPAERIDQWLAGTAGQFLLVVASETVLLGILFWFIRKRKADWHMLGFLRAIRAKDVGLGLLWFVIYFALLMVVSSLAGSLLGVDLDQKQELGFDNVTGAAEKLMALVSLVLLPPLVEESLFRGFMFTGLRKKLRFAYAAVIVSLIFGSLHLLASSSGPLWIAGIDTFLMSLVLCHLREKTGALYAPMVIHFLKNGLAFLFLYVFVS